MDDPYGQYSFELPVPDALRMLKSQDPSDRFRALVALRFEYSPHVGDALVRHCIEEPAQGVWWMADMCALPLWLPLFDRTLMDRDTWPFSGARTLHVLEKTGPRVLHSATRHIDSWLGSDDWAFKFAAFRWLQVAGELERARELATQLFRNLEGFRTSPEDSRRCSWMDAFNNTLKRAEELSPWADFDADPSRPSSRNARSLIPVAEALEHLRSSDPSDRFRALVALRFEYSSPVGEALVRHCIEEAAPGVWWLAAMSAIPIWLPIFDDLLLQRDTWPFSGGRTLRLFELACPHPLHSAARFVDGWLESEDWAYRFSAFRWLNMTGDETQEHVCKIARTLLKSLDNFQVNAEDLETCSWMEAFNDSSQREQELAAFMADNCIGMPDA